MLVIFMISCFSFYLYGGTIIYILNDELERRNDFKYSALIVVLHSNFNLRLFKLVIRIIKEQFITKYVHSSKKCYLHMVDLINGSLLFSHFLQETLSIVLLIFDFKIYASRVYQSLYRRAYASMELHLSTSSRLFRQPSLSISLILILNQRIEPCNWAFSCLLF